MRRTIFWFAAFCFLVAAALFGARFLGLNSTGGLMIGIFLGYCAIIVLSQLFSCLSGLRSLLEQWTEKKRGSRRVFLR